MKGRPPGTAKSDDPNKKKRKRQARERDLCDVKIKITEYFPGAKALMGEFPPDTPTNGDPFSPVQGAPMQEGSRPFGMPRSNDRGIPVQPGDNGERFYTIQRVNGNGANGKGDGTAGAHKHTIEDSDRVKKSSVQRHFLKEEKERRKSSVSVAFLEVSCLHSPVSDLSNSERLRVLHAQHIRGRAWACGCIVIVTPGFTLR